jgi:acyl-CoA thioesterase
MFTRATAVVAAGDGRWDAVVEQGWDIAGNANGGYLLAILGRALSAATGRPHPLTTTAHYLRPGVPGPVTVEVETVRSSRRFTTARATLRRDGEAIVTVLSTLGDLGDTAGPDRVTASPPPMPDPDRCVPVVPGEHFPPPFMGQVELRLHPEDAGFRDGRPSGVARIRGWFRLPGDEPIDAHVLLCAVDAFPPTVFNADLPVAWTPTLELTAHVRALPAPGWLRCSFGSRFVTGGFLEADGEIWDADDRLVAQSRQLALVPLPPTG